MNKLPIITQIEQILNIPPLEISRLYDTVISDLPPRAWPTKTVREKQYDVFLCHNSKDKTLIKEIGTKLKAAGIIPWLDEWDRRPGNSRITELEKQINNTNTAPVFFGPEGNSPWQKPEIHGFLLKLAKKKCRIIPVILPDCTEDPEIPAFPEPIARVDYRTTDPDPFEYLLFGITGVRNYDERKDTYDLFKENRL